LLQRCPREQGEGDGSEEISDSQVSTLTKVLGVLERHNNNLSEPIVAARTALSSAALERARVPQRKAVAAVAKLSESESEPAVCSFCCRKT